MPRVTHPLRLITTFGLGRLPASGTWGSLPPVLIAALLMALGHGPTHSPVFYSFVIGGIGLLFTFACIRDADAAEARFGKKDPGQVVADETAAQCIPLLSLPSAALATPKLAAFTLFLSFIAFRLLDITKPFPAKQLQSVPGGWGILLDDLFAGVYAAILINLLAHWML